jgi:hypothetical protein
VSDDGKIRVRVSMELEVSEAAWRQRYALDAIGWGYTTDHVQNYMAGLMSDAIPVRAGFARIVDVRFE